MTKLMTDAEMARVRRAKARKEQDVVDSLILTRQNTDLRRQLSQIEDDRNRAFLELGRLRRALNEVDKILCRPWTSERDAEAQHVIAAMLGDWEATDA